MQVSATYVRGRKKLRTEIRIDSIRADSPVSSKPMAKLNSGSLLSRPPAQGSVNPATRNLTPMPPSSCRRSEAASISTDSGYIASSCHSEGASSPASYAGLRPKNPSSPENFEQAQPPHAAMAMDSAFCHSEATPSLICCAERRPKNPAHHENFTYTVPPRTVFSPYLACLAALAILLCLQPIPASAQGFGSSKKTITLHRKLPGLIHLPGNGIDIRPVVRDPTQKDLAQALSDLLLVTLQKNDTALHVDKTSPDVVIAYSIITYQTPPPTTSVRQETQLQKGKFVQVPVQYYKVTGELTIAYQATDAHKRTLDAGTITKKYAQDFQAGTNQAVGGNAGEPGDSGGAGIGVLNPFRKKKPEELEGPPNPIQLRQKLMDGVIAELAPRFVNTTENVDVLLSRGKPFDDANKLAEKDQWTRYLETLETMTPLGNHEDDAYRLYNIGVANEALAYQAEDKSSVQKFLDQAAINYGKAIDAKPSEKYFIDPQNRIETAVAHYKKLNEGANTKDDTQKASNSSGANSGGSLGGQSASGGESLDSTSTTANGGAAPAANTRSAGIAPKSKTPATRGAAGSNSTSTPASAGSKPAGKSATPAISNADIIKMAKAGVDEDSIIAAIQDAAAVDFDLSPDGLIALANNGVKGKVVSAMRTRAKRPAHHAASPGSN